MLLSLVCMRRLGARFVGRRARGLVASAELLAHTSFTFTISCVSSGGGRCQLESRIAHGVDVAPERRMIAAWPVPSW